MIFSASIEILLLCLWTLWLLCFEVQSLAQGLGSLNEGHYHSGDWCSPMIADYVTFQL